MLAHMFYIEKNTREVLVFANSHSHHPRNAVEMSINKLRCVLCIHSWTPCWLTREIPPKSVCMCVIGMMMLFMLYSNTFCYSCKLNCICPVPICMFKNHRHLTFAGADTPHNLKNDTRLSPHRFWIRLTIIF